MPRDASLELFAHVAARPEAELDLFEAALLVAEPEYPNLDAARYDAIVADMAVVAKREHGEESDPIDAARRVLRYLYVDLGFRGNRDQYYDPKNSFLNEVIDRRKGIPISLAVLLVEVCKRAGIDANGVAFPGHFLVRLEIARGALLVDPFEGQLLDRSDLQKLLQRAGLGGSDPEGKLLEPAKKRAIVLRMLANLRGIYKETHDDVRLRGVIERMNVLEPTAELGAELARLGGRALWTPVSRGIN